LLRLDCARKAREAAKLCAQHWPQNAELILALVEYAERLKKRPPQIEDAFVAMQNVLFLERQGAPSGNLAISHALRDLQETHAVYAAGEPEAQLIQDIIAGERFLLVLQEGMDDFIKPLQRALYTLDYHKGIRAYLIRYHLRRALARLTKGIASARQAANCRWHSTLARMWIDLFGQPLGRLPEHQMHEFQSLCDAICYRCTRIRGFYLSDKQSTAEIVRRELVRNGTDTESAQPGAQPPKADRATPS
jgi:hypothetical protein